MNTSLIHALHHRLDQIVAWAGENRLALELSDEARRAVGEFESWLDRQQLLRLDVSRRLAKVTSRDNIQFDGMPPTGAWSIPWR